MNYLKLIDFKKTVRWGGLFICSISLTLTSCRNQQAKISIAADTTPLPITYITTNESNGRQAWFNNHKLPIIDALTINEAGVPVDKKLDFKNLKAAIDFFEMLILNQVGQDTTTGIRVYLASAPLNTDKCGKLTLIFTATAGKDTSDLKNYYRFKNGELDNNKLDTVTAKVWVQNYQLNIRPNLLKTMDVKDPGKETKHIWFSKEQIKSIIGEMGYQMAIHQEIVNGFGIRFTSYTDRDYMSFNHKWIRHHKRLTIGFTFIDWENEDIGIKQIDAADFKRRSTITKGLPRFHGDTFDTGDPTPPPSNDNKAALDVSNQ